MLAAVLITAAYLRMGQAGIVEYKRDEANLSQLALDFAHGGDLPLLGISSSVGIPNAPINVYILAIPYFFDSNPLYATQFIGFLNVMAVALTYWLARRYTNPYAALLAALFFAVSPWSIIFSRKIWAQNMLPPFIIATVLTGILGFVERKPWAQILHLPLLVITGQIHYGAFVIIPVSIYVIWIGRQALSRVFVFSVTLAFVITFPYLIGMVRAGFDNLDVLRDQLASDTGQPIAVTDAAVHGAAVMIAGTEIHSLAGPERFVEYLDTAPDAYWFMGLLAWLVAFSVLWLVVRVIRWQDWRTPIDVALLIWLGFPILAYSVTWTEFFIHYLIPIMPAAFLILAFALYDLWYSAVRYRRALVVGVTLGVVGILVFQAWMWLLLLQFVDEHDTPDGFGTPLHYLLQVRSEILEQNPQQVLAALGEQALIYDNEPSVWNTLLYDMPVVRFVDDVTHVYPAEDALTLSDDCRASGEQFLLRQGMGCYVISSRSAHDFDPEAFRAIEDARFANGVRLRWYQWDEGCLSLAWEIFSTTEKDYFFAVHFVNEHDERLASGDGLSWFGRYWRPGDLVVREFCLTEPDPAISDVHIGMYTYVDGRFDNVDLLDSLGNLVGQSVKLSLR